MAGNSDVVGATRAVPHQNLGIVESTRPWRAAGWLGGRHWSLHSPSIAAQARATEGRWDVGTWPPWSCRTGDPNPPWGWVKDGWVWVPLPWLVTMYRQCWSWRMDGVGLSRLRPRFEAVPVGPCVPAVPTAAPMGTRHVSRTTQKNPVSPGHQILLPPHAAVASQPGADTLPTLRY